MRINSAAPSQGERILFIQRMREMGNPSMQTLQRKLRQIGGNFLVPHACGETETRKVLDRGELMSRKTVNFTPVGGKTSRESSSWKYLQDPAGVLCSGYALDAEKGLWRQHSWLMHGEKLIETSKHHDAYFGVRLNPVEALCFAMRAVNAADIRMADRHTSLMTRLGTTDVYELEKMDEELAVRVTPRF